MKQAYVVTEGERDIEILKKLLANPLIKQTVFAPGIETYGAMSLASTLLSTRRKPVVLVVDTNTRDESAIYEKVDTLRYLLRQAAADVPFKVLPAIPEIEAVFFEDRNFVERIIGRKFSDLEWKFAKLSPKEALTTFLGAPEQLHKKILSRMTKEDVRALQHHSLIVELSEFLESALANGASRRAEAYA
ncbi:hypothetical protein HUU05_06925 [candidate division KSB1 bacterium]|nr:hypothetical protein [candidate division KSB1 bacterium]